MSSSEILSKLNYPKCLFENENSEHTPFKLFFGPELDLSSLLMNALEFHESAVSLIHTVSQQSAAL